MWNGACSRHPFHVLALSAVLASCSTQDGAHDASVGSDRVVVDSVVEATTDVADASDDIVAPLDVPCASGRRMCSAGCVDLSSDVDNCGACANRCPADARCVAGVCACNGGRMACGDACVDTSIDPAHCGACDRVCATTEVCLGDVCAVCPAGTNPCTGACVDLASDLVNCGGCGHVCDGTIPCTNGVCECPAGQTQCGVTCVDLARSDANCGGCGQPCARGTLCEAGACQPCAGSVSFAADVQPIFTRSCLGAMCHEAPVPAQDLDLEVGLARAQLVGVPSGECGAPRVDPGSAATSAMMHVLVGEPCGDVPRMPLDASPLPNVELDAIREWICQGAPDN